MDELKDAYVEIEFEPGSISIIDPNHPPPGFSMPDLTRKAVKTRKTPTTTIKRKKTSRRPQIKDAVKVAAQSSLDEINAQLGSVYSSYLGPEDPAFKLSTFSAPQNDYENGTKLAYAALLAAKKLKTT